MKRYFWDAPGKKIGLNADIERHRKEAQELDEQIAQAEKRTDKFSEAAVRVYRHSRYVLELSLAEVVNKLGRKKR